MNILAPPRSHLTIEVVFDLVCPWCRLGVARLHRALRGRPEIMAELRWRPFLLNPDIGPAGLPRHDYMARKFGGEERARRLHATIADLGRGEGLVFNFDLIRQVPPSLDAHRLVRWAAGFSAAATDDLVEALFTAHFAQGRDIGHRGTLAGLAAEVGLEGQSAYDFLLSGAETEAVHAENLRAHRLGINGVPCFVVQERHAIAGAQEPEVLERLLDVALAELTL